MNRLRWAIRWRLDGFDALTKRAEFRLRSFFFLLWYRDILGKVVGGRDILVRQRVRIVGPGTVYLGERVKFGQHHSPSWRNNEILIMTKFRESSLSIGSRVSINNNNVFVVVSSIRIADRVFTGHDCQFYDSDLHSIDPVKRRGGDRSGKQGDVVIDENVMIGAQVTIGPGTEIGQNSVVGMCSYTRWKNFPADFVIAGNPARAIMKIEQLLAAGQGSQNRETADGVNGAIDPPTSSAE